MPHVWCSITEIVEAQERSTAFWEYYCGGPGVAYHVFNVLLGDPGVVCGYCEDPGVIYHVWVVVAGYDRGDN